MPRIDPERLLKTLAPLLESSTGSIKSLKEVDKIYGLMSKFSKKLVSKCTYINILKASEPDVLDLFLQRGGWDMILQWTQDAQIKQNCDLLKEIGGLLLCAPASIQRLKDNELPKVWKSLSKESTNEEIRDIAKRVVAKWVAIAKVQDSQVPINRNINDTVASNIAVLKVDNFMGSESENVQVDFDISSFDITPAELNGMMDFNPEDFTKAVDQHLGEFSADSGGAAVAGNEASSGVKNDTNNIKMEASSTTGPGETMPKTPKILIKTIAGQKAVVQGVSSATEPAKQGDAPFCIIMRDGKPFLVRLKLASPNQVNQLTFQAPDEPDNKTIESPAAPAEKKRRPRKDPSIVNARKGPEERHVPNILKTYSKTKPAESVAIAETIDDSLTTVKTETVVKPAEKKATTVKKSRSGSSKSGSAAAAAAAKKQADEEKLREKIKKEKVTLKKRAKDAAKQKQQEKDQETLKKLNLSSEPSKHSSSSTSPGSMKIPKIPKRQSSFADAIGVPGAVDPLIAVHEKSNKKSPTKSSSHDTPETADGEKTVPKFYGKSEETVKSENSHERRHRVKVFSSKKSRSEDLLKDMTENVKNSKSNNKADISGKEASSQSTMMGDKSAAVHSIIANAKPEKRPSTEGIEKPGDAKKQKLSDEKADKDKKKELKERESKAAKDKAKLAANVLKESSLFMDALTASTETQKTMKRKRRLSSSNEKDVLAGAKPGLGRTNSTSGLSPPQEIPVDAIKPAFNFYRDTLGDNEKEGDSPPRPETTEDDNQMEVEVVNSKQADDNSREDDPYAPTPTIYEGALKSALVIHRTRNKPKKCVRWREEEEIKEVFLFELDEQERVNVTKQKDFMSMKEQEKAEEKEFLATNLKRRILGVDEVEEKMPWRKPVPIVLPSTIEFYPCLSEEKGTQEEREKLNLGLFLPPGALLPDNPAEPDPMSPDINEKDKVETRVIPVDDVLHVTKVYDKRNDLWPKPDGVPMGPRAPKGHLSISSGAGRELPMNFRIPNFNMNELPPNVPPPGLGFPQTQNPAVDYSNPWTNNFSAPPPSMLPKAGDMAGFQHPPGPMNMSVPPPIGFGNPFGFPLPNAISNFPVGVGGFPGNPNQMLNNVNRERDSNRGSPHHSSRGRGGTGRDYGDRDLRTSLRDRREPYDSRTKDSYDSRGRSRDHRSRDHDRDRRSPSPNRRRRDDRDRHGRDDKDYRDHDYRSRGRTGKKDVPCRYFRKGHCHSGSRCEFSHGDPVDQVHDKSRSDIPRARHSSPSLISDLEETTSGTSSSVSNSITSQFERRPSREDGGTTNFTDAPSSPTDEIEEDPALLLTPVLEPAKIIPVE